MYLQMARSKRNVFLLKRLHMIGFTAPILVIDIVFLEFSHLRLGELRQISHSIGNGNQDHATSSKKWRLERFI